MSVRYELAPDHFIVGDVLEMSVEGMFIEATKPLPVGRLFTLEIRVLGEPLPIDAVGRVMWRRETGEAEEARSGFGVKLVDLDEAASALVGRLVAVRQQTMSGIGSESPNWLPPRAAEVSVPFNLVRAPRATEPSIPFPLVTPLQVSRAPEVSVPFLLLTARQHQASRPAPRARAGRGARAASHGSARRVVAAVAFFGLVVLLPQDGAGAAGKDRDTSAAIAAAASAGRTAAGAVAGAMTAMTGWATAMTRKSPWHEHLGSAITAGSSRSQER